MDSGTIAQALGSQVSHGHEPWLTEIARGAWSAAIREAPPGQAVTPPGPYRTGEYDRAGAGYVRLTADTAELHRRAGAAGRPQACPARIDQYLGGGDPQPRAATRW